MYCLCTVYWHWTRFCVVLVSYVPLRTSVHKYRKICALMSRKKQNNPAQWINILTHYSQCSLFVKKDGPVQTACVLTQGSTLGLIPFINFWLISLINSNFSVHLYADDIDIYFWASITTNQILEPVFYFNLETLSHVVSYSLMMYTFSWLCRFCKIH